MKNHLSSFRSIVIGVTFCLILIILLNSCPIEEPVDGKEIISFVFRASENPILSTDVVAVITGSEIRVEVPSGTDVTSLIAVFTTTGNVVSVNGTIQISGFTENDFTETITYRVTANDGSNAYYSVTVLIEAETETVSSPYFTPYKATFESSGYVTIQTDTSGASIYYTTDGSDPDESSTPYSGQINITGNTVLKAIAIKPGSENSDIADSAYAIVPAGETNMVSNGDFSQGLLLWDSWVESGEGAEREFSVSDGAVYIEVIAPGDEIWYIGLYYEPYIEYEQGKIYEASFDAYSTETRSIFFYMGEQGIDRNDDGVIYTPYLLKEINLTTTSETYTAQLGMTEMTDPTGEIAFYLGIETGDVIIDNVVLEEREPSLITSTEIPNANLRQAIADSIDIDPGVINEAHLLEIENLDCGELNITDISGIDLLSNLKGLSLWRTEVNDISPLIGMTQIESLDLQEAPLTVSAIGVITEDNFPNLKALYLCSNGYLENDLSGMFSVIQGNPQLERIGLMHFDMGDTSFNSMFGLIVEPNILQIVELRFKYNELTNLSLDLIATVNNLEKLDLKGNPITSISALTSLNNLSDLELENILITDLTPLQTLYDTGAFDPAEDPYINITNCDLDISPGTDNRAVVDYLVSEGVNVEWEEGNDTIVAEDIGFTPTELGFMYHGLDDSSLYYTDVYIYDGTVGVEEWATQDTGIIDILVFEMSDYTEGAALNVGTYELDESGVGTLGRFYGCILAYNYNADTSEYDYIACSSEWLESFPDGELITSVTVAVSVYEYDHTYDFTINLDNGTIITGSYTAVPVVMIAPPDDIVETDEVPDANLRTVIEEHLGMSFGEITLEDIEGLQEMKVDDRGIADITGLELCLGLETIDIEGNSITDFSPLYELPNLVELHLGNFPSADLSGFTNMTGLERIMLNDMPIDETDIGIFNTTNFPNLDYLGLWAGGSSFTSVAAVVDVLVNDTGLYNYGLGEFNMTDTEFLYVYNTLIAPRLGSDLAEFTELRLPENSLTGSVLTSIVNMTSLKTLQLSDNPIGDLSALSPLTNLEELDVHGSGLAGTDLSILQTLYDSGAFRTGDFMGYGGYVDINENNLDLTTGTANRNVVDYLISNNVYVDWERDNITD